MRSDGPVADHARADRGGRHVVVVGSSARADEPGIHVVEVETSTGRMAVLQSVTGVANPSYLAVAPDRTGLYAVSETGEGTDGRSGRVYGFAVDDVAGAPNLVAVSDCGSGGDHPCHIAIDPGGRRSAVSNYGSGSLSIIELSPRGALGPTVDTVQHDGSGPIESRQRGPHVHGSAFTPDGRHLVVADLGADRVVLYGVDPTSGSLQHLDDGDVAGGAGPRHVVIHPTGRLVVVANELSNTVSVYRLDPVAGRLVAGDTQGTLPADAPDGLVAAIRLSTAGDRGIVSNRGHDSIAVFDLDRQGGLTIRGVFPCGGRWPRDVVLLPDGRHLLVANERSHDLALLPLTPDGASIGPVVGRLELPSPMCIAPIG